MRKLTILFDLDDTLLINDMETFAPAYLRALGKRIAQVPSDRVIEHLMKGTQKMISKNVPDQTLEQTFDQHFYPGIGISKEEMWDVITKFYAEDYPSLEQLTQPIPEAIKIIEYAVENDHQVVIATNPLFPKTAIFQRLEWAGLSPDRYPFALVTTYESLHFCKPSPAYYMEILAQLCWPEQLAIMVGNEWENDILPPAQIGMPTFWITDQEKTLPDTFHTLSGQGQIEEVISWLEEISTSSTDEPDYVSQTALTAILKSTPAALDTLSAGISKQEWEKRPSDVEWSLTEIICHLCDVDREINLPRLQKVCKEDNPFLPGISADPWAEEREYNLEDGPTALKEFIEVRTDLLDFISCFSPQDWQKPAQHAIFGPTDITELTSFITTHDRVHIHQTCTATGKGN